MVQLNGYDLGSSDGVLLSFSNLPLMGDLGASFIGRSGGGVLGKSGGFFFSQS